MAYQANNIYICNLNLVNLKVDYAGIVGYCLENILPVKVKINPRLLFTIFAFFCIVLLMVWHRNQQIGLRRIINVIM